MKYPRIKAHVRRKAVELLKHATQTAFYSYLIIFSMVMMKATPSTTPQVFAHVTTEEVQAEEQPEPPSTKPQSYEEVIRLTAKSKGLSDKQADQLICIAKAESGMRADAKSKPNRNGTKDHGLFQINDGGTHKVLARVGEKVDVGLLYSPFVNIKAAVQLYTERGPQPWSVYTVKGLCK